MNEQITQPSILDLVHQADKISAAKALKQSLKDTVEAEAQARLKAEEASFFLRLKHWLFPPKQTSAENRLVVIQSQLFHMTQKGRRGATEWFGSRALQLLSENPWDNHRHSQLKCQLQKAQSRLIVLDEMLSLAYAVLSGNIDAKLDPKADEWAIANKQIRALVAAMPKRMVGEFPRFDDSFDRTLEHLLFKLMDTLILDKPEQAIEVTREVVECLRGLRISAAHTVSDDAKALNDIERSYVQIARSEVPAVLIP